MSASALDEHVGGVGEAFGELLDDPGVLGLDLLGVGLVEDGADEGGHHGLGGLGHLGQHVAHEVGPAALPGRSGQHRGDGVDEAPVGVGDDQGHAREPPGHQAAQEGRPARPVLGGDEVEAEDLPVAVGVHPGGDDDGHVDDAAALSDLLGQGVEPDVGVGTGVEGAVAEGAHRLVEGLGQLRDLGLGDPVDAHGLDHVVDPAGGDPFDVALGDHRDQGPLGPAPGLDEPVGEVAAGAQLGDGQLDRAGPGVPAPRAVAVARVDPLGGDLAVAGVAQALASAAMSGSAKAWTMDRSRSGSASSRYLRTRTRRPSCW